MLQRLERSSTRISGPTSRAEYRGSRPGEPHDAEIIRDAGRRRGKGVVACPVEMARPQRFERLSLIRVISTVSAEIVGWLMSASTP